MSGHNHSHGSSKRLVLSLVFTTAFAGVEVVGGLWSGSLALLADAGHMATDSLSLGIGAFAAWLSQRPASSRHTYGLPRAEVVGALINVLFMFGVIVWIAIAAVQRLLDPQPVGGVTVMIVAAVGLLVNVAVAWILMRGEKSMNVRAALLHVMGDLLGSVAALAAGLVIYLTGWLPADPLLSLFISLLIAIASINLLRDVLRVLMEGAPRDVDVAEVNDAIRAVDGVTQVHDLHVWSLSSSRQALSAHVQVDEMSRWAQLLPQLETMLAQRFDIHHATLQPETGSNRADCTADCGAPLP